VTPLAHDHPLTQKSYGPVARRLPTLLQWTLYLLVAVLFVALLALRGGPGGSDATAVVLPTTAISHGQLRGALSGVEDPNPPGYPLVAAAFVAALRPLVGASDWCVPVGQICSHANLREAGATGAGAHRPPPWYRSQAALVVLAWLVLETGLIVLLGVLGLGATLLEAVALFVVALTPATSDAAVSSYHPQDLLCVGLLLLGVAAALCDRWLLVGLAFGAAFLAKQFALLAFFPVLVGAPAARARLVAVGAAATAVAVVLAPFVALEPAATLRSLQATGILGSSHGLTQTVVGSATALSPDVRSAIARYAPFFAVAAICVYGWSRRRALREPRGLLGLVTACVACRLVFEVAAFRYYLLAASVFLVCLDCAWRRWPVRSAVWIVLTSLWWQGWLPSSVLDALTPLALLAAAVAAIWIGIDGVRLQPEAIPRLRQA
jgi:hypothetical protein